MVMYLCIFVFLVILYYCWKNHLHINFLSFFKKGFHKNFDDYGLYCYVNVQGGGKTYSAIDFLEEKRGNRKIVTNVKSYYERHKEYCEYEPDFYKYYERFGNLDDCSGYILFYDELFSVLDNKTINKEIREFCTQFRKRKIHMFTTCQVWSSIPIELRKLTRFQITPRMFNVPILGFALLITEVNDGYGIKWDGDAQEYVCPRLQTNIKKCPLSTAKAYDTNETIKGYCSISR